MRCEWQKDGDKPLNIPDLNPVEYSIWAALQQLAYCHHHTWDDELLKEVLQTCWEQTGKDVIDCQEPGSDPEPYAR